MKKTAVTYRASVSSRLSQSDVDALAPIVEKLSNDGNGDVAWRLVLLSKPKTSPTHHLFEWDLKKAAEAHWKDRAAWLIRSIEIVFDETDTDKCRAFPSLQIGNERMYVPMSKVLTDRQLTDQLLEQAKADAELWAKRHAALKRVTSAHAMFKAVEQFIGKPIMS